MPPTGSQTVRFLHVPKTAGTSVNGILETIYTAFEIFDFSGDVTSDLVRLRALAPADRSRLRLFRGHAPRYLREPDVDQARTFTLLREPVARVVSFCRHVAEGKSDYLRSSFPPEGFDLDKFLGSGCEELSNFQSRMLLGEGDYASIDSLRDDPRALQDRLVKVINGLRLAGIQEKFEESMLLLGRCFGWRVDLPRKRLNQAVSSREVHFSARHLERIRQLNDLDAKIYRLASETLSGLIKRNRGKLLLDRWRLVLRRRRQRIVWEIEARLRKPELTS